MHCFLIAWLYQKFFGLCLFLFPCKCLFLTYLRLFRSGHNRSWLINLTKASVFKNFRTCEKLHYKCKIKFGSPNLVFSCELLSVSWSLQLHFSRNSTFVTMLSKQPCVDSREVYLLANFLFRAFPHSFSMSWLGLAVSV